MPRDKSRHPLQHADYVKLPIKPQGDGLKTLLKYKRGLEIFGIWCLLLEKTTEQKPENRGKLLNHKDEPATPEEIAMGISLEKKVKLVSYALSVLSAMDWVNCAPSAQDCGESAPLSEVKRSEVKRSEVKNKVKHLDFVFLTNEEYQKLINRFGKEATDSLIEDLDTGIDSKGYKYTNHYKTIINWAKRAKKSTSTQKPHKPTTELMAEYNRQKAEGNPKK